MPIPEPRPVLAALWMLGAVASFSAMALAGRALGGELDTFEIMAYRSVIGLALVLAGAALTRRLGEITTARLPLHLARNLSHFAGQNLWFHAVTVIPFAQVFALEFTSPLWVLLLAPLVLGERLTRTRLLAALVGFAGILLVARPGTGLSPGIVAALLAAVGFAGSILLTKLLTRSASIVCILFWLTAMQAVMGWLCAGWDGAVAWPSAAAMPLVVLVAGAGLFAHLCLTAALSLAPATVVMPIDFLRLPLIAAIGAMFYGEAVHPGVFAGAVLIFAAGYANLWAETRRHRGRSATEPRGRGGVET